MSWQFFEISSDVAIINGDIVRVLLLLAKANGV